MRPLTLLSIAAGLGCSLNTARLFNGVGIKINTGNNHTPGALEKAQAKRKRKNTKRLYKR
jgi:hypothetical protein